MRSKGPKISHLVLRKREQKRIREKRREGKKKEKKKRREEGRNKENRRSHVWNLSSFGMENIDTWFGTLYFVYE